MDNLTYWYYYYTEANPSLHVYNNANMPSATDVILVNRLAYVTDGLNANNFTVDTDNQPAHNYGYDQIGNLTKDMAEVVTSIEWTVSGKIKSVVKSKTYS